MAFIYRNWRILAASALSLAMIAGAHFLARAGTPIASAASNTELLQEIATRDSTGDGVPDWEKPLYGIPLDATTTDYFHLGMTDGEAIAQGLIVPKAPTPAAPAAGTTTPTLVDGVGPAPAGSLTDAFSKEFFSLYIAAKQQNNGAALTSDQVNALAQQTIDDLSASVGPAPDFANLSQIKTAGTGPAALRNYAEAAQAIFAQQKGGWSDTDLNLLQAGMTGDASAYTQLASLAASYQAIAQGLLALSAPQELSGEHLALINALARVGEIDADFSRANSDALSTILALNQYPQAMQDLANAFLGLSTTFTQEGVVLAPSDPGGELLNIVSGIASSSPQ